MIIRNSKFKRIIPDSFTYKGTKYTKAYAKGKQLFGYSNDYTKYFTIESLEDGNEVKFTKPSEVSTTVLQSISYSTDGTNWTTIQNVDNQPIDQSLGFLNTGDKMYFKGSASAYATGNEFGNVWRYSTLLTNKTCNVYGNIMSLLYGANFSGQTGLTEDYVFMGLFSGGNIVSAADLVLPATNMTFCCYKYLFSVNGTLTTPPVLPSTSLADQCYEGMFIGCTSLSTAPALPATTLANNCYYAMFSRCTSLTTAPALPATTLANNCYYFMFANCTGLKSVSVHAVVSDYSIDFGSGLSASGTYYVPSTATGYILSACPTGWTISKTL